MPVKRPLPNARDDERYIAVQRALDHQADRVKELTARQERLQAKLAESRSPAATMVLDEPDDGHNPAGELSDVGQELARARQLEGQLRIEARDIFGQAAYRVRTAAIDEFNKSLEPLIEKGREMLSAIDAHRRFLADIESRSGGVTPSNHPLIDAIPSSLPSRLDLMLSEIDTWREANFTETE